MRVVDFGEKELQMMLQEAARAGRNGDTELVHINKDEEKMLKEAGGAGTINPKTGLKEYGPQGGQAGGSDGTGKGKSDGGGGNSGSGERGTASQQQDRRNQDAARRSGNAAPGVKGSDADRASLAGKSPTDVARSYNNKAKAKADFAGEDDTFIDKIGNFVAGMFGVGEIDPETQAVGGFMNHPTAQIGVDPLAAGLALASAMFPPAKIIGAGLTAAELAGVYSPQRVALHDRISETTSMSAAERSVQTAAGARQSGGGSVRDKQSGGEFRNQNGRTLNTISGGSKNTGGNKPTAPQPAEPKSPADVLMERYKLPGINAPFDLAPYNIDRTRHEELVTGALAGRQ